jgi:hypothetical protein
MNQASVTRAEPRATRASGGRGSRTVKRQQPTAANALDKATAKVPRIPSRPDNASEAVQTIPSIPKNHPEAEPMMLSRSEDFGLKNTSVTVPMMLSMPRLARDREILRDFLPVPYYQGRLSRIIFVWRHHINLMTSWDPLRSKAPRCCPPPRCRLTNEDILLSRVCMCYPTIICVNPESY